MNYKKLTIRLFVPVCLSLLDLSINMVFDLHGKEASFAALGLICLYTIALWFKYGE